MLNRSSTVALAHNVLQIGEGGLCGNKGLPAFAYVLLVAGGIIYHKC